MPQYHDEEYWNLRYQDEVDYFEWYCSYGSLEPMLSRTISRLQKRFRLPFLDILDFGCGTSTVTRHLAEQHRNLRILSIDRSAPCIQFMAHTLPPLPTDHGSTLNYKAMALEAMSLSFSGEHRHRYHLVFCPLSLCCIALF